LQDCRDAHQHHQDLEQISEASIAYETIDEVKTERADDGDDEYVYQD